MTDLPLAPGSEWRGLSIVDSARTETYIARFPGEPHQLAIIPCGTRHAWLTDAVDVRALLHSSGNLPEIDELARLKARMSETTQLPLYELEKLREAATEAVEEFEALLERKDVRAIGYIQWSSACATLQDLKALLPAEPKEPTNG